MPEHSPEKAPSDKEKKSLTLGERLEQAKEGLKGIKKKIDPALGKAKEGAGKISKDMKDAARETWKEAKPVVEEYKDKAKEKGKEWLGKLKKKIENKKKPEKK